MIKELLQAIIKEYDLSINKIEVIHDRPKSMVAKLYTNQGQFVLKTLYNSLDRQRFILDAEEYLSKQGIHIPQVRATKTHQAFFIWKQHPYVLQNWISGNPYPLISRQRIKKIGSLLGKMHNSSLGFETKQGHLYAGANSWEQEYEDDLLSLQALRKKMKHIGTAKATMILKHIDFFLKTGEDSLIRLKNNNYFKEWKNTPSIKQYLCHGDFHTANVMVKGDTFYIIDWEDVRYDFPSKDISRLLYVIMRREGKWNHSSFEILFSSYLKQNPLTNKQKGLLFLDLSFPHIFERFLRKKHYITMSLDQINQFSLRERKKTTFMQRQIYY